MKQALQGAELVARGRKRGAHRKRRARRPLPGMLLHIDGSRHQWFQDEPWYDLLVILDDASSEIYYAQLVEEESTATVMAGLKGVIGAYCGFRNHHPVGAIIIVLRRQRLSVKRSARDGASFATMKFYSGSPTKLS
ncbi:MAG TPA: hypothetical protein VMG31_09955 [Verrucomicrobiae bacterium]|nr:hypothetical protein [Verrucomicrobiae bacterium]